MRAKFASENRVRHVASGIPEGKTTPGSPVDFDAIQVGKVV
jgi:hypothetical protein